MTFFKPVVCAATAYATLTIVVIGMLLGIIPSTLSLFVSLCAAKVVAFCAMIYMASK